ncbi:hypothetical protein ACB092_05G190300 [Castanea dentata]
MEYRKLKDQDEDGNGGVDVIESQKALSVTNVPTLGDTTIDWSKWKLKIIVVVALTLLMSSQSILIVETLKCGLSLLALARIWRCEGVTEDNRLSTTFDEVIVYPIPALLYLVKNLLQYHILQHLDAPGYQILKNLNIISTGILLSNMQWVALIQLCIGCVITQLKTKLHCFCNSDDVFQTPVQGWVMAIVMALLSGFAGVYTEVYSTSVAMLFTALVSSYIFGFNLSLTLIAGLM